MNTNRKSKITFIAILLLSVTLFTFISINDTRTMQTAYADMGPKPSVIVTIENLDGRVCYGTLLSYSQSLGPTHAYSPDYPYIRSEFDPESEYYDAEEHAIWKAFVEYADPDGYYYQQIHWKCHETGQISWTYYPPSKFKILLYFPDTQTFVSSDIYERYAFHSYFCATLSNTSITVSQPESLNVQKNYDYTWEIISLIARIVATVLIELGLAYLFRLRTKKQIIAVTVVNVVTQTAMNVGLNLLSFFQGAWGPLLWYIPIEIAVFVVEAIAYSLLFHRKQPKTTGARGAKNPEYVSRGKCVLFSLVANLLSFVVGFVLALFIPGIF